MGKLLPIIEGHFSIGDLLREAAERSIELGYVTETIPEIDAPAMSGMILAEEVQPGLLVSGFDLTYTAECRLDAKVERSVCCAVLLEGSGEPLEVQGHPPVTHEIEHVVIFGFGETKICTRPWHRGQHAKVFSVTLEPRFFERFGDMVADDGIAILERYIEPGVHSASLPWSRRIVDQAHEGLVAPYGGSLRSLFRESQALRFTLEVAALLQEEEQLIRKIGRRQYDRVRHARELLDRSLVEPPKLLDLARELGVNVSTLQANFKAAFGTTIFGYVRSRRLEMARILIHDHGLGIAEAGYRVGFTNAAAFTVAYRRHYGHPPSARR
ncbi:hypothetical protein GCM10011349_09290 [Novosphingobium indicum]|uniref:HTH araC/xylS-type domain-containing protein n=1 Tax=Novosphingobium indicum TaxID=462949 RepID=A0ABQ2JGC5_9SPHN|nr:AraC family transcriptional regulator [Novosphingobium indicum]GGN44345.1 hypothetical protein GCM10011349_09290 [Novosphingobium indicum]